MAPTTFSALKAKNDTLVTAALDWAVLLHLWEPGAPYMPDDITDSSGVLQSLPAGWMPSGEVAETAGVSLAPDLQTSPVRGYGSAAHRRVIPTSEAFTIDYTAQEWRKVNLAIWNNVRPDAPAAVAPGKGWKMSKSSKLDVIYYSALLVARDAGPDGDLYPWFAYPKVSATKRGAAAGQIGKEIPLPLTLTIFEDADFVDAEGVPRLYDFGVAGAGMDDLLEDAGFVAAATSISVHPGTADLADGDMLQLLVRDDNGIDRTSECSFTSGTPATATVSASGLVTAVDVGTATITATLGALTDTCAVTVA
ncbi:Ig-like domain-containing protein [Nocardia farcinica]|uniref:Ig-like domain-containing protein n=1 Tax=Nocardia farcinica TaxID=37329 RepID=UPI00189327BE|nr:Ig-like domain-containing protein [Nocardia farcinica]MBF6315048.1 Ig-like domain-containing protein [Nocardia farcinica]